MFNKKGVDAVVATVLIIMITVAAAAVIWAFVVPMIKNSAVSSTAETAKLSIETSGGYTTWDEVQKIARVQIKRGNDNVNLTGLDFNFVKQGNSKKNQTNEVPQPNQIKVYEFNLSDFGKPEKVTVAPITASGVGNVVSQSDVIQNYSSPSIPVQNQVTCVSGLNVDGKIVICNCTDLQNMNQNLGASYILGQDIDCTETKTWNGGAGFFPVGNWSSKFAGNFDGKNKTIQGIFINLPLTDYVGLFGMVSSSDIKNVVLDNVNISGNISVGALVGRQSGGIISNCSSSGIIYGRYLGGLVGYQEAGGVINRSYSTTTVIGFGSSAKAGGLLGIQYNGSISNSYSLGVLNNSGTFPGAASGGLVGMQYWFDSFVNNSFSSKNVNGIGDAGGLVGMQMDNILKPLILNSFSTGDVLVTGTNRAGGLVSYSNLPNSIVNSYWNNKTTNPNKCYAATTIVGCTAIQNNEAYFYSKLNAPMSSWDFTNIWQENANGFPTLR